MVTVMSTLTSPGRQGTIGQLLPTYEARLVDDVSGKDAQIGKAGELWVRGPSVMKGYLRNHEATRRTFETNWFKTGDIATIDQEGFYRSIQDLLPDALTFYSIVDRLKELIKYKGFQGKSSLKSHRSLVK